LVIEISGWFKAEKSSIWPFWCCRRPGLGERTAAVQFAMPSAMEHRLTERRWRHTLWCASTTAAPPRHGKADTVQRHRGPRTKRSRVSKGPRTDSHLTPAALSKAAPDFSCVLRHSVPGGADGRLTKGRQFNDLSVRLRALPLMWTEAFRALVCLIPPLLDSASGRATYLVTSGQGAFFSARRGRRRAAGRIVSGSLVMALGLGRR